jgi:hypothetical protein
VQTDKEDSAFPIFDSSGGYFLKRGGLCKREYFAEMALQGLLCANKNRLNYAVKAVQLADELIKELNLNEDH